MVNDLELYVVDTVFKVWKCCQDACVISILFSGWPILLAYEYVQPI